MSNTQLEAADAAAGAVAIAPRVTLQDVLDRVGHEHYIVYADILTICILTTHSGFHVVGTSCPASAENFNEELGRELARKEAIGKLWGFEGYKLRDQLFKEAKSTFEDRLLAERDELKERLEKLQAFLDRGQQEKVPDTQRSYLNDQRDAMRNYLDILNDRIDDLGLNPVVTGASERDVMEAEAFEEGASDPRPTAPEVDKPLSFE